jgi:hypothetical protein
MEICDDMGTFGYGKNFSKISVTLHKNIIINELIVACYCVWVEIFNGHYHYFFQKPTCFSIKLQNKWQ